jgi:hypothetical protein
MRLTTERWRIVGPALTGQTEKKSPCISHFIHVNTKQINTLCGQNAEFCNVKAGGTYCNQWALNANKTLWPLT